MRDRTAPPNRSTESSEMDWMLAVVGAEIKKRRKGMNLTLEELSQRSGVSRSMLSLVERGKAAPSLGSLVAIAAELRRARSRR